MNDLKLFLIQNPVDDIKEEVRLPGRLKDFPITVRALDGKRHNEFQKLSVDNANSAKKRNFNTTRFNELIITNCVVEPNFKDAEFIKALGVVDAVAAMYKTLLAGEITDLSQRILELSGFGDEELEESVEEAKNS